MQQGGPPHGNQPMGGGYIPPNQPQQPHQPGMNQQMGYYQQQPGQYGQMGMPMGYQGPGGGAMGQPQPMQQPHGVQPHAAGQPHPVSQGHPGMPSQPQHPGMMQQSMYGQQSGMGGRPQYMQAGYGNMPTSGAQVSMGQHQPLPGQPPATQPSAHPSQSHPPSLVPAQPSQAPISQAPQHVPVQQPPTQQPSQPAIPPQSSQQQSTYMGGLGQSTHTSSSSTQPGASGHSSGAQQGSSQAHSSSASKGPKKQLTPPGYSTDVLENLDRYSVGGLCTIAKELIHDLNLRTVTLCSSLKAVSDRKPIPGGQDVDMIIDYSLMLFDKLNEIRIRIDNVMGTKVMKPVEFLQLYENPEDPPDSRPQELKEKLDTFNKNSGRLISLSHDLKLLDWMATVSDPSLLKKVDKMSCLSQQQQSNS